MESDPKKAMRVPTLVLMVTLALFYNAEYFFPDMAERSTYHFMYVFGTLAAGAVILVAAFCNLSSYLVFTFWALTYLLVAPHFNGGYTLEYMISVINLMEAASASGVATLTYWYMKQLGNSVLDNYRSVDYSATPPRLEDGMNEIKYEITRARRYNRAISVIMIQPAGKALGEKEKRLLSSILNRSFRRTERLYDIGKEGRSLIFCPETTASSAEMLVNRIRILAHREQEIHFVYGIATFPDQELTFEGLLSRAKENLNSGASRKTAPIKAIKDRRLMVNR